jgi:hypothetical protein
MNAGRELDALVAEKVMGFHKHHAHDYYINVPDEEWDNNNDAPFPYYWPQWGFPPYSTSIADAWLVVEKLRENFDGIVLAYRNGDTGKEWRVEFNTEHGWSAEYAETAPMAICLAALEAIKKT